MNHHQRRSAWRAQALDKAENNASSPSTLTTSVSAQYEYPDLHGGFSCGRLILCSAMPSGADKGYSIRLRPPSCIAHAKDLLVKPTLFAGADCPCHWGLQLGYRIIGF